MTNVGNLNATLSLSQFEFNTGLKQSETAAMEFATTVEVQSRRADAALGRVGRSSSGMGGAGKAAMAVQQIGFGLQDFSSQLETRGLSGAIGAVTNNVQMLGAAFGPVGMAVTALGGALGGILLPRLLETGSIFGKTKEEMARFEAQIKKTSEAAFAPWRKMENIKFDVFKGTEEQMNERLERMQHDADMLSLESHAERAAGLKAQANGNQDEVDARNKRIIELNAELELTRQTMAEIEKMRPDIQDREAKDAATQEELQRQDRMYKAESDLKRKMLEEFGTAEQRQMQKIERERTELIKDRVSQEAMAQFESQAAVQMQKAKITDEEKKLSEMGQAAGMSPGAARDSAEGVKAVNRATSGTRSDQSIAKEALKIHKDSLIKLEEIARQGGKLKRVALSG
ncbi:MAG: hypothetical protein EBR82_18310 [Caulobacteraceae bacterium]|nr:hypothetical protein [Caulobacteraceae bacterium]